MITKLISTHKHKHLVVIGAAVITMVACGSYLVYLNATRNILPDQQVESHYTKTQCQIVSKKLNVKKHFIKTYRADFLVSYAADRVQFRRWVSGNGLDQHFTRDAESQEVILTRYHVGGDYPCYYNPQQPETAVLVLRHYWGSIYPAIFISLIGFLALFYFIKNIIMLLKRSTHVTQEPREPQLSVKRKHRIRKHK